MVDGAVVVIFVEVVYVAAAVVLDTAAVVV